MKSKSGKEIIIHSIDEFSAFKNEKYEGFKLAWDSNIGFGEMLFSKKVNDKDATWEVQTECMSTNDDKEFIRLVLDRFVEELDVIE